MSPLLCAYLRLPCDSPADRSDVAGLQEREVRAATQNVFERHLQPVDKIAELPSRSPGIAASCAACPVF